MRTMTRLQDWALRVLSKLGACPHPVSCVEVFHWERRETPDGPIIVTCGYICSACCAKVEVYHVPRCAQHASGAQGFR